MCIRDRAGTPQIKTTLILKCLSLYQHKLDLLAINEEKDVRLSSATSLFFPRQYLRDQAIQQVKTHLKQYDYLPLINMDLPASVHKWATYAQARFSFDFELSHQVIQQLTPQEIIGGRTTFQVWKREIMELKNGNGLLKELYWNARIKYKQGAYVDFLTRFFRVVEELAKSTAVSLLGGFIFSHGTWGIKIKELLDLPVYQPLANHLQSKKKNGRKLNYQSPNITTFKAIIEFYQTQHPALYQFLKQVESLTELRNHSIGAHAFEPVSNTIINQTLKQANTSMTKIFAFLDEQLEPLTKNAFDKVNMQIIHLLGAQKHGIV